MAESCLTAPRPDGANSADATALGASVAMVYRIELMIRFDHPRTAHLKHENRAPGSRPRSVRGRDRISSWMSGARKLRFMIGVTRARLTWLIHTRTRKGRRGSAGYPVRGLYGNGRVLEAVRQAVHHAVPAISTDSGEAQLPKRARLGSLQCPLMRVRSP